MISLRNRLETIKKEISKKNVKGAKFVFNKFCHNLLPEDKQALNDCFDKLKKSKADQTIYKLKNILTDLIPKY